MLSLKSTIYGLLLLRLDELDEPFSLSNGLGPLCHPLRQVVEVVVTHPLDVRPRLDLRPCLHIIVLEAVEEVAKPLHTEDETPLHLVAHL